LSILIQTRWFEVLYLHENNRFYVVPYPKYEQGILPESAVGYTDLPPFQLYAEHIYEFLGVAQTSTRSIGVEFLFLIMLPIHLLRLVTGKIPISVQRSKVYRSLVAALLLCANRQLMHTILESFDRGLRRDLKTNSAMCCCVDMEMLKNANIRWMLGEEVVSIV
jgi:hypothetical protein